MHSYSVGPELRFCFDRGDAIALDLRRNRYVALPGSVDQAVDVLAARLCQKTGRPPPADAVEIRERAPPRSALELRSRPQPDLHREHWRDFLLSCARAEFELRRGRLDRIVDRLSANRGAGLEHRGAEAAVRQFVALRPWWPRRRKCLFDCLALAGFLACRGVRSQLVFGVRARPFYAHCWLERDGVVLNDAVERTQLYSVIAWS